MLADMMMNLWRRGVKHTLFKFETPRALGIIGKPLDTANLPHASPRTDSNTNAAPAHNIRTDWRLGITDKVITIAILVMLVVNLGVVRNSWSHNQPPSNSRATRLASARHAHHVTPSTRFRLE